MLWLGTMIDAYVKVKCFQESLNLHDEIKCEPICWSLCNQRWFIEIVTMCKEIDSSRIRIDVVTYNIVIYNYENHD